MKRRAAFLSSLLIIGAGALLGRFMLLKSSPLSHGPLRHEVYAWQRAWTQPVREAVQFHGTNFSGIVPLRAEIFWKDKLPQLTRVAVDYPTLAKAGRPIGFALRIGPYAGPFLAASDFGLRRQAQRDPAFDSPKSPDDSKLPAPPRSADAVQEVSTTDYLCNLAASLVAEAKSNHLALAELQIDFDCAESKLDGYRLWVEAIQRRVAPLPVTITALPSWLNAPAFKQLAAVATNYALQVHSVERPKGIDAPFTLCNPVAASRAVERAGRIGVPFRVALPTYGYTLAFDAAGKFLGLSAEGPRPNWPTNAQLREIRSDPIELSALVQGWTTNRPAAMRGVIWYRLPTIVDNFNWRWPTLGAIVASRSLHEKLRIEPRRVEAGLTEIMLVNEGELDISSRLAVEVRWSNARLIAGDGLRDFELADRGLSAARFQTKSQFSRLPAGDRRTLGWLRFDHDCEVQCELKKL